MEKTFDIIAECCELAHKSPTDLVIIASIIKGMELQKALNSVTKASPEVVASS